MEKNLLILENINAYSKASEFSNEIWNVATK
jgi:hypothetical protein